ncbi:HD domain-containing phosphohydrolase [Vibrio sp. WJH972]
MVSFLENKTFSLRVTVTAVFLILTTICVSVALSLHYYFSQGLARDAASNLFESVADKYSERFHSIDGQSTSIVRLLSFLPDIEKPFSLNELHPATHLMLEVMREQPYLQSIYVGYENDNLYQLINLESEEELRQEYDAAKSDRWLVIKDFSRNNQRKRLFQFYDTDLNMTWQYSADSDYFATDRAWYQEALASKESIRTDPYLFAHLQIPGVTYAKTIKTSKSVIAVDITYQTLSSFLSDHRVFNSGSAMVFNENGQISAHSFANTHHSVLNNVQSISLPNEDKSYLKALGPLTASNQLNWPPFDFSYSGHPQGYSVDLLNLVAAKLGMKVRYTNGYNWSGIIDLYQNNKVDIIHSIFPTEGRKNWGHFTQPYLSLSTSLVTNNELPRVRNLSQLSGKTVAIPKEWSLIELLNQEHPDIKLLEVEDSLEALKAVQHHQVDAALETTQVAQYLIETYWLNELTVSPAIEELNAFAHQDLTMLVHSENSRLQALLNLAIESMTEEESLALKTKWMGQGSSTNFSRSIKAGVVPFEQLVNMAKKSDVDERVMETFHFSGREYVLYVQRVEDNHYIGFYVDTETIDEPYMQQVNASTVISLIVMLLLIPILLIFVNVILSPIKALQSQSAKIKQRDFKSVICIHSRIVEINDLSESMYAMSVSLDQFQDNQKRLMDSFIKLIAQAIDDKSPHTANHCERVPALATMLAEQANNSQEEGLKSFKLTTDEEWREFEIAAWLHDCGKITTPEHIVDKGTKLEAIYNRIHQIRMRFEVLLRDIEIDYWKKRHEGGDPTELNQILSEQRKQVIDDFEFIARCNIGGESMSDSDVQRVRSIATQTWVRNLDDRLGLSPEELKRISHMPPQTTPRVEQLLADKQEHLYIWPHHPKERNSSDIKIYVPDYQANLGEVYNLCITRGTLTEEDRYRIREHVISSIRMLEALPLTDDLKRVPQIAGGHHETLDGKGYPKKLEKKDLCVATRILALADVFEALTASDRPYKDAKKLSEAIGILHSMVERQCLDRDLFEMMLKNDIHIRYAEKYMPDIQIDEVDISQYV